MKNVLVLHRLDRSLRRTTIEFVSSFARYAPSDAAVTLWNIRRPIDENLLTRRFDSVFLMYDLLALRTSPQWEWAMETVSHLSALGDSVWAFPQDDYTFSGVLDRSLETLGVEVIYSPIESGLDFVYPRMIRKAEFRHALTGYVEEETAHRWAGRRRDISSRSIDVGQRVRMLPAWYGRVAQTKGRFAQRFLEAARQVDLRVDISTDEADAFAGEAWYRFLQSCRATLGQRGGASLCDPDGSIMECVTDFLRQRPYATFDEIEKACFDGLDGLVEMKAVSPRLFDAAMLGTVQILIEDDYLGVLEPWVHYIPTDPEVSNIEEVANAIRNDDLMRNLARNAEETLVRSGQFTYKRFVEHVLGTVRDNGNAAISRPSMDSAASELQVRLTPELFDGLQRITRMAYRSDSCSALASLADVIEEILTEEPSLVDYLGVRMLEAILGEIKISPTIDPVLAPTIDILVECSAAGALPAAAQWLRHASTGALHDLQLVEWIDWERMRLDEGVTA